MLFKVGTQDANAHPASPCLGTARHEEELERNAQPAGRAQHRAAHLAQNMRQRCHTPIRSPPITRLSRNAPLGIQKQHTLHGHFLQIDH